MSVIEILKKIHSDAEVEATQLQAQAAEDVERLEQAAAVKRAELQATYEATRDRLVARDYQEVVSKAEHVVQIALQREKRAAVDRVLKDVFTKLTNEDDDTYQKRYQKILQSLPLASASIEKVETAPERVTVTTELLTTAGITAPVEPNESISGGMLISTGTQQFDCTLDSSFAAARPQLEMEVARVLFS